MSLSNIVRGRTSVGLRAGRQQSPTLPVPDFEPSEQDIIQTLTERLANLEIIVEGKAQANQIRTLIAYSDEAVLIKAQDIVLAGDVTIAKIINEQNGTTNGEVPISITRIIGDRIRTGVITSNNFGASAGTSINLNDGTIIVGGTDEPSLSFASGNLTITGTLAATSVIADTVTVGGQAISAIKTNASTGASHAGSTGNPHGTDLSEVTGDLDDIANGSSFFKTNANEVAGAGRGFNALDASFNYVRGLATQRIVVSESNPSNGIVIDSAGVRAYASGSPTFTLNASTGAATFAGTVSAGSIITSSVTVDGVPLSVVNSNATTGASHAVSGGNPHGTNLSQISGDLDDIANGSAFFKTNANEVAGAGRGFNALDGSSNYVRGLSTQRLIVSESNPSNGIVMDSAGVRAYAAGSPTFTLNASTGAATFAGDVETTGRVVATGGNTVSGVLAAMHAIAGTVGGSGIYAKQNVGTIAVSADATSGWAVLGVATTGLGVEGRSTNASGIGVQAENTAGGVALDIPAGYIKKLKAVGGTLEVWDTATNTSQGVFFYEFRS